MWGVLGYSCVCVCDCFFIVFQKKTGHDGFTGVKKVIFTKKASSLTECVARTRDMNMH